MKLRSVSIRRMPGITRPFRLEAADLGPGLNLVVGPNAVGKSSLCRAVRALLWPEAEPDLELDAEASWEIDGQVLTVCAVPGRPRRWSAGDEAVAAIELPPAHLAGCYSISLLEVIRFEAEGVTDEHLQKELRRQLAGGYDLDEVERLFQGKPKAGRSEVRALSDAERAVRELARRREALAQREARLDEVRRERDAARRAARRAEVLGRALEVARKRRQLGALRADAERRFPEGIERLAGDEKERLDRLRAERAEVEQKIAQARAMIAQAAQDTAVWGMEDDPPTPAALEALRIRAQEVLRARDAWLEAEQAAEVGRRALEQARRALGNDFDPAAAGGVDEVFLETLDRLGVQREQVRARLARAEQAAGQTTVGPAWLPWLVAAAALALGLASLGLDWARPAGRLLPMAGAGLTALAVWLLLAHRQRRRAAATLAEVQEEWEAACRHWRALEEQVGIDLPEGDLHSGSLVGKLRRWQQADADQQRLEAGVQVSSRRHQTLLEEIAGALARWKVEAVPDAAAAQAAVADLATRAESHRRAQDRRQEAECRVADLEQRLERLNSAEAELFARAGVKAGDDPGAADRALVERLALRDEYLGMVNSRNELEWQIDQAERELGEDIALAERDPAELEEEIEALEFEAGRFDALQQQVADTEAEVQQARRSHDMARALEARGQARRDLERALEGQLLRAAGRVLMRRVRERHARDAAPKVLARAARLLAHFTRQGYELRAEPSSGRLQVRDGGSGEVLGLRALSDGTRAQVRLAARLAFAFEAEGRHRLPVWLDEALTAADPERFAAVADSLIEVMLREDRQVFYLSANPSDVEAWQQALERRGESRANVIDL
ncbi:MAG TPA: hypothetical protein ENK10_01775, partial [Acidobacteria bacterium]|nr:hypothetical protein [Acidobacteriota bacterium]